MATISCSSAWNVCVAAMLQGFWIWAQTYRKTSSHPCEPAFTSWHTWYFYWKLRICIYKYILLCIINDCPLYQWSLNFLTPGTGFVEDNFSMDWAGGCFKMVQVSLHLFLLIWHQVHLRLSGIRSQRLGTPDLSTTKVLCQRRQWHPTPVLLPGKSHGWRSLVGCSPRGRQESDTTEWLHFHALEKEMAPHSSVLAWRIPGMGEPGGLLSMGSHRVRHDWSDLAKCYADFFLKLHVDVTFYSIFIEGS